VERECQHFLGDSRHAHPDAHVISDAHAQSYAKRDTEPFSFANAHHDAYAVAKSEPQSITDATTAVRAPACPYRLAEDTAAGHVR
jgi:hypothetical protein